MIKSAPIKILSLAAVVLGSLLIISFSKEKLIPQKIEDKIVANINGSLDSTLLLTSSRKVLEKNQSEYAWKLFSEVFKPTNEKDLLQIQTKDWMNSLNFALMENIVGKYMFVTDQKLQFLNIKQLNSAKKNTILALESIDSKLDDKNNACDDIANYKIPNLTKDGTSFEITYMNKPLVDYLASVGIFKQNVSFEKLKSLNAPKESKEVKLTVVKRGALNYTNEQFDKMLKVKYNGTEYGVIASHIITKDLKNWFYSTFEFSSNEVLLNINKNSCNVYTSRDSFGRQNDIDPISSELKKVFVDNKCTSKNYENYVLRGTQTLFKVDSKVDLLGNTIIENGAMKSSSCISCHSYASVIHSNKALVPNFVALRSPTNIGLNGHKIVNNDTLRSTDFMWSIGFRIKDVESIKNSKEFNNLKNELNKLPIQQTNK